MNVLPMKTESDPKDFPICVVDDDSDVRLSIRTLLESADFTVKDYGSANAFLFDDAFDASCLVADKRGSKRLLERSDRCMWPLANLVGGNVRLSPPS